MIGIEKKNCMRRLPGCMASESSIREVMKNKEKKIMLVFLLHRKLQTLLL